MSIRRPACRQHLASLAAASQRLTLTWRTAKDVWCTRRTEPLPAQGTETQGRMTRAQARQRQQQQQEQQQQLKQQARERQSHWRTTVALFLDAAEIALLLHQWRTDSGGTTKQQNRAAQAASSPGFATCTEQGSGTDRAAAKWFPKRGKKQQRRGAAAAAAAAGLEEEGEEGAWADEGYEEEQLAEQQQQQQQQPAVQHPQQQTQGGAGAAKTGTAVQGSSFAGAAAGMPSKLSDIQLAAMERLKGYAVPWHKRKERMAEARQGGKQRQQAASQPRWNTWVNGQQWPQQQWPQQAQRGWGPQLQQHEEEEEPEEGEQPQQAPQEQQAQQARQAAIQQAIKRSKQILKEQRRLKRAAAAMEQPQQQQAQQPVPKRRLQDVAADMQRRWVPASNDQSQVPAQPDGVEVHPPPSQPVAAAATPAAAAATIAADQQVPEGEGQQDAGNSWSSREEEQLKQQLHGDILQQTRQLETLLSGFAQLDPSLQQQLTALLGQLESFAQRQQAGAGGGLPEQQPEDVEQPQPQQQQEEAGGAGGVAAGGRAPAVVIPPSNIGFQLLVKAGWSEGSGLGARRQGRLEPVQPAATRGRGLGFLPPAAVAGQPGQPGQQAQQAQQPHQGKNQQKAKKRKLSKKARRRQRQLAQPD